MSRWLQVVIDDSEYAEIEAAAARKGETVSHWVRQSLRRARREPPDATVARKLALLRSTRSMDGPTGDIEDILDETAPSGLEPSSSWASW